MRQKQDDDDEDDWDIGSSPANSIEDLQSELRDAEDEQASSGFSGNELERSSSSISSSAGSLASSAKSLTGLGRMPASSLGHRQGKTAILPATAAARPKTGEQVSLPRTIERPGSAGNTPTSPEPKSLATGLHKDTKSHLAGKADVSHARSVSEPVSMQGFQTYRRLGSPHDGRGSPQTPVTNAPAATATLSPMTEVTPSKEVSPKPVPTSVERSSVSPVSTFSVSPMSTSSVSPASYAPYQSRHTEARSSQAPHSGSISPLRTVLSSPRSSVLSPKRMSLVRFMLFLHHAILLIFRAFGRVCL